METLGRRSGSSVDGITLNKILKITVPLVLYIHSTVRIPCGREVDTAGCADSIHFLLQHALRMPYVFVLYSMSIVANVISYRRISRDKVTYVHVGPEGQYCTVLYNNCVGLFWRSGRTGLVACCFKRNSLTIACLSLRMPHYSSLSTVQYELQWCMKCRASHEREYLINCCPHLVAMLGGANKGWFCWKCGRTLE